MQPTFTISEYQVVIDKIEAARDEIERALNSISRGYAPYYSREARDIFISIDETIDELRDDQVTESVEATS